MDEITETVNDVADGSQLIIWLIAIGIMIITAIVSGVITHLLKRVMRSDGSPLPSSSIIINIVRAVVWIIGISIMLSACFGVDVNGLLAALGVGGVAVSLGMQDTLKNFIGGLQVTLMGIVHPGDHIAVGSTEGIVQDVSWRQTVVKDYEGVTHLIPNAVINSTEVSKIEPGNLVSTIVVLNNDGRDMDALMREMETLAKQAVEQVAELEKDPWLLVTQIGEYGVWAKMRFVLTDTTHAREARDAALRAIAPYTRNDASQVLPGE